MRVSGCNSHYEFVLCAGAKAKSVTNNLPILSVLAEGVFLFRIYQVIQFNYFTAIFFVIIQHFVNFSFIITRNTI